MLNECVLSVSEQPISICCVCVYYKYENYSIHNVFIKWNCDYVCNWKNYKLLIDVRGTRAVHAAIVLNFVLRPSKLIRIHLSVFFDFFYLVATHSVRECINIVRLSYMMSTMMQHALPYTNYCIQPWDARITRLQQCMAKMNGYTKKRDRSNGHGSAKNLIMNSENIYCITECIWI